MKRALLIGILAGCSGKDVVVPDDTCAPDCAPTQCGDGVVDAPEACDDGAAWGGDGCDATCAIEVGAGEVEPNDDWEEASSGNPGNGALPEGDVDCWSVEVPACGAVSAVQTGECGAAMTLALHDPDGALLAVGSPDEEGCAKLDPADQPGARWVQSAGMWSVCAASVSGAEIRGYTLDIAAVDPLSLDVVEANDPDGDGIPGSCDPDRDGDGLLDGDDNCPDISNGPETTALALSAKGYVRTWLAAGPFTTGVGTGDCRPSADTFVGEPSVSATVGDPAGDLTWSAAFPNDHFDFNVAWGATPAPREAYVLVYLDSPTARSATLAVGADDGFFGWWNGEQVFDNSVCQGVTADQWQEPVEIVAGTNTLLLKIYDQGGGWGVIARLLDESGAAITDLVPSLGPDGGWLPDQTDSDGDGLGDVCDPEP